ncbi:MAG: DUF2298 domain-containing protein [Haloarculaceae archaeon]
MTASALAALQWLLACLAVGLAAVPVVSVAFSPLGRYATAFAVPAGLAVLGLVGFWIGHLSIAAGLVAGLVVLVGAGAVASRRVADWGPARRGLPAFGVFLVAFLFVLGLRALDPAVDPASGEKFLDFGLLAAHLRAQRLPVEDFWFAGQHVSYYYGGQLLAALLARLTDTPARYVYNLSLATFYATLVTAAYGLAGAVGDRKGSGTPAALSGAFLVGFASNLTTVTRAAVWALPDGLARALFGGLADEWARAPAEFHYWAASRVVPGTIDEFPLFAYLNGDLHAHMLAAPFSLLAIGALYAAFRTPARRRRYRLAMTFGVFPAVAGFVAVTNLWSLPTLVGLTALTLYFGRAPPSSLLPAVLSERVSIAGPARLRRLALSVALAAVAAALAAAWSLPFWLELSGPGLGIGLLPDRSPLWTLLVVWGPFVALTLPYLAHRLRRLPTTALASGSVAGSAVVVLVGARVASFAGAIGFAALVLALWFVLEHRHRADAPPIGYEAVLLVGGFGVVCLVELAYLTEPSKVGRFNTVFKTYAQVWVLLGVAGGAVIGRYVRALPAPRLPTSPSNLRRTLPSVLLALFVASLGVYGVFAVQEWTTADGAVRATDEPTLDAVQFAGDRYPDRTAAIRWLGDRPGTPTLVSATGKSISEQYRWVNAPSSLTGVPTVAGWAHEAAFRGHDRYWNRVRDVRTIYEGSPADRRRLLDRYDVRYVYYGPLERSRYGQHEFGTLAGVTPAYRNDAVTIYRVNQSALSA